MMLASNSFLSFLHIHPRIWLCSTGFFSISVSSLDGISFVISWTSFNWKVNMKEYFASEHFVVYLHSFHHLQVWPVAPGHQPYGVTSFILPQDQGFFFLFSPFSINICLAFRPLNSNITISVYHMTFKAYYMSSALYMEILCIVEYL